MIVAGVGFRSGAVANDIAEIVRRAERESGRVAAAVAAPSFKAQHEGLRSAAKELGLPLLFVAPTQLEAVQSRCLSVSMTALNAVGVASVAEACALAALDEQATLLLPRIANTQATCALAIGVCA